jgi:hypothetical protein
VGRMEELRKGADVEQVWFRSVRQTKELPRQGLPKVDATAFATASRASHCSSGLPAEIVSSVNWRYHIGDAAASSPDYIDDHTAVATTIFANPSFNSLRGAACVSYMRPVISSSVKLSKAELLLASKDTRFWYLSEECEASCKGGGTVG